MDISIFLAQVFGLYFVIIGLALLARPKAMTHLMESLSTRESVYLTGIIALMVGVPLVLIHNVWDGTWRVLITFLIWLVLIKGVTRVFFPDMVVSWIQGLSRNPGFVRLLVWFMLVVGLYLLYLGFYIV